MGEIVVDQQQHIRVDVGIDGMEGAHQLAHLPAGQRADIDPTEDPRPQHRFARKHLPAAVPADQDDRKPRVRMITEITQKLDTFTGQPPRLSNHQSSRPQGQLGDKLVQQHEPAPTAHRLVGEPFEQSGSDQPHDGPAGKPDPTGRPFTGLGQTLFDRIGFAQPAIPCTTPIAADSSGSATAGCVWQINPRARRLLVTVPRLAISTLLST